jgi:hypothetical protein
LRNCEGKLNRKKGNKEMTKQLEKDSNFNQFDTDHDGVVTDAELARSERMMMIENMDKMADQQRVMAWAALGAPPALIAFMASALVTLEKVNALSGLTTTYCAAMGTIVVAFMAAQAYVRGKTNDA